MITPLALYAIGTIACTAAAYGSGGFSHAAGVSGGLVLLLSAIFLLARVA